MRSLSICSLFQFTQKKDCTQATINKQPHVRLTHTSSQNSKLKLHLCICTKPEIIRYAAPPQQSNKPGTMFLGQLVLYQLESILRKDAFTL